MEQLRVFGGDAHFEVEGESELSTLYVTANVHEFVVLILFEVKSS
jgi:hypothetical protein